MIIESLCLVARPDDRRELQAALSFLLGPVRVEAGCLSCQLYQNATNPDVFYLECAWKSKEHLIAHLRSDNYRQLLILMESGAEPPWVQFHTVSATHGLELVHSSRQHETGQSSGGINPE